MPILTLQNRDGNGKNREIETKVGASSTGQSFLQERWLRATLAWLYEESESNNSENGVISTSSCNTMTPIHQTCLLLGAVCSHLFFSLLPPPLPSTTPCGEYLAGISFLEEVGLSGRGI